MKKKADAIIVFPSIERVSTYVLYLWVSLFRVRGVYGYSD